ncbi:hypothetical protein M514_27549 [Trichuris suis]|uniref:Uncharacterized protein n=1 Tax=Trichuris suis TaxID=68888 RepID=A0A085MST1_9BILA|nr:hypothetical protein M514_27549 [Trichuris suis]
MLHWDKSRGDEIPISDQRCENESKPGKDHNAWARAMVNMSNLEEIAKLLVSHYPSTEILDTFKKKVSLIPINIAKPCIQEPNQQLRGDQEHRLLARTGEPFCSIGTTAETERSREHKNGHEKSEDETGLFSLAPVLRLYGTTGRCDRFIKRKDLIMRQKTEMQRRRLRTWRISYVTSSAVIAEVNEVKANGHIKEEKEDK